MTTPTPITRRSLFLAAGVAASAATAAGCAAKAGGGSSSSTTDSTDTSTGTGTATGTSSAAVSGGSVTLMGYAGEHSKDELAGFTKRTGIKVNFIDYTYDKFVSMIAAKKYPDVVRAQGGLDAPFLYVKKLAEPLDPYVAKSSLVKKDDLGDINNLWRFDGTTQGKGDLLGLVKDYSSDLCLWVNKQLVPDVSEGDVLTYDQVKEYALKATQIEGGRVKTYGYEFYDAKPHIQFINAMCRTAGKEIFSDDLSSVDFSSAEAVQSMQFLRDLVEAKATVSSFNKSTVDTWSLFKAGRLAILQSGYWTQGMWSDVKADMLKNYIMLPAPKMGDTRLSPVLSGSGHFMCSGSSNKDNAWKFMEDYFGGEPAKARAKSGWGVPAMKSLVSLMPTATDLNKETKRTQTEEDKYFEVLKFTPYAKVDGILTAMSKEFDSAIKNKQDTATMCANMQKAVNDLIARGKR